MTVSDPGLLAIIYSIEDQHEVDYLHWVTHEHTLERVSIDGFLNARIFRNIQKHPSQFLTLYELASSAVMASAGYLARLNAPTPWSQKIMPLMKDMARGGGRITASADDGEGGFVAALRFNVEVPEAMQGNAGAALVARLADFDKIMSVRILEVEQQGTAIKTREKKMRGGDSSFGGLLIIEGLDLEAVKSAAALGAELCKGEHQPESSIEFYAAMFARRRPS